MSLVRQSQHLMEKLADVGVRVDAKSAYSDDFKKKIMEALGRIASKVRSLLDRQRDQLGDIEKKGRKGITDLEDKLKNLEATRDSEKASDIEAAAKQKQQLDILKGVSEKKISELEDELKKPNPDVEALRQKVTELTAKLDESSAIQAKRQEELENASEEIRNQQKAIDEAAAALNNAIANVDELLKKVEAMHITSEDLQETLNKLTEIETMLGDDIPPSSSGNDDSGTMIRPSSPFPVPGEKELDEELQAMEMVPTLSDIQPEPESGSISVRNDPDKQSVDVPTEPVVTPPGPKKDPAEQGKKQKAAKVKKQNDDMMRLATTGKMGGRKTRKKGGKKRGTIKKKGGYVLKKNSTRHRKQKKKRASSSSSSSTTTRKSKSSSS